LDLDGHVCELSAANIFLVRNGKLISPGLSSDILEGINRKTIMEIASADGVDVEEREVDMTELYVADEVFTVGTSAFVAGVVNIDGRMIGDGKVGKITQKLKDRMISIQSGSDKLSKKLLTKI
jgi:branched-chain amino acid aminotransferase